MEINILVTKNIIATNVLQRAWFIMKVNKLELGDRIRLLREIMPETQTALAEFLGVKRQIISYYENGTRLPSLDHLVSIAVHYNTTTDYLLGLSDDSTPDYDIQAICNYTGLSEFSIERLHKNQLIKSDIANKRLGNDEEFNYKELKESVDLKYNISNWFIADDYFDRFLNYSRDYIKDKKELIYFYHLYINSFFNKELIQVEWEKEEAEFFQDKIDLCLFRIQQLVTDFVKLVSFKEDKELENINNCIEDLEYTLSQQIKKHYTNDDNYVFDDDDNIKTDEELAELIKIGEKYGYHKETQ